MLKNNKKGVALFVALGLLLVVVILANIILAIILSQSRLTHHQVSRIQAYYGTMAGINFAIDKLRRGDWAVPTTATPNTYTVTDSDFPSIIQNKTINITIIKPGETGCINPPGGCACIVAKATYTSNP